MVEHGVHDQLKEVKDGEYRHMLDSTYRDQLIHNLNYAESIVTWFGSTSHSSKKSLAAELNVSGPETSTR